MITYKTNVLISVQQYTDLLKQTSLGERRPIDKPEQIEMMLKQTDVLVTAWYQDTLVGLARSVTDFAYCCYLSDLAVSEQWQKQRDQETTHFETQKRLSPLVKLFYWLRHKPWIITHILALYSIQVLGRKYSHIQTLAVCVIKCFKIRPHFNYSYGYRRTTCQ